nr:MAG TPA: hypothetical protein [Caudoviricetes sp.]
MSRLVQSQPGERCDTTEVLHKPKGKDNGTHFQD